jgi:Ca2+-transporting ATPase
MTASKAMSSQLVQAPNQNVPPSEASCPHAYSLEMLWQALDSNRVNGLADSEITRRQNRHGFNELAEAPPIPAWRKLLGQFNEVVIGVLIVAAVISGLLGEWTDALAILAIVVLNGLLGFLQEEKAERALAALQKLSAPVAKVVRNGRARVVPARELVPGDRIELEAGDSIPADARLIEARGFRVQEAALTGESTAQDKVAQRILDAATPLADRCNMVYMGTVAAAGKASALVVATGMATELGRIAGMLQRHEAEPTPLQKRLAQLGRTLALMCLAIVGVVFIVELLQGDKLFEMFLLAVSLAVAAVPEGLPAVVTIALALGLQRMVRRNALIRRLPSVETLGSVTVICSDKTGTLTRNEMTVREMYAGELLYKVTGAGYQPQGEFLPCSGDHVPRQPIDPRAELALARALGIGAHCNNARLIPRGNGEESWQVMGDPTEGALLVAAAKARIDTDHDHRLLYEIPFDSDRKAMSVVLQEPDGSTLMYAKGAPEVILGKCSGDFRAGRVEPITGDRREEILQIGSEMAGRALRVLALAYRPFAAAGDSFEEANLVFAGLAGMMDPPREEVRTAVHKCHEAGIRPIMITGDHPATAMAIARELGIAGENDLVVAGPELDALDDMQLTDRVDRIAVYARVSAEHKLRIIRAWKKRGQIVAMTGDGINDAPALKAADIGIAMGQTGTDVAKEASAMVLTDDNFASIVNAVEEGRGIFDNIQKVLQYLLSCNFGEILLVLVAGLLGWPVPLLPVQLLWINLVTDGLPALALAVEPPEPGVMRRRPRRPAEPILSWRRARNIVWQGVLVGGSALTAFGIIYLENPDPENVSRARTMAFCVLVYGELLRSLAARSQNLTLFQLGVFTNPYLLGTIAVSALLQLSVVTVPFARSIFESTGHFAGEWLLVMVLALIPVTVMELTKMLKARSASG